MFSRSLHLIKRPQFGLAWLAIVGALSFLALLFRPVGGHYLLFSSAARAFWQAAPMYDTSFDIGRSGYFYSPSCAAFFYSIFAYLPSAWGRGLYVGTSLVFLGLSIWYLRKIYQRQTGNALDQGFCGQLIWVMLSSELNGAILAEKLEISILAIFFFSLALCWERRFGLAIALLLIVANWKFQSLPLLGLLLVGLARERRFWVYVSSASIGFAVLFFLPFLFQDADYLWGQIYTWRRSLSEFIPNAWMAPIFHHVYGFVSKTLGLQIALETANTVSAIAGAIFAIAVGICFYIRKADPILGFATVFGLGAAYSVLFSPLSQGTGFIIYLPLPLLVLIQSRINHSSEWQLATVLVTSYYFVSLCVSDLTPHFLRAWFYAHAIKSVGPLLLTSFYLKGARRIPGPFGIGHREPKFGP